METKGKKILMIDDDQESIDNTFKELKKINFNFNVPVLFESKTNAEEAVFFLRENHVDVILLDGEFKGQKMQGLDALKEIRSFSKIPIIMITPSIKESCLVGVKFGASGFMPKGLMSNKEVDICKQELEKFLVFKNKVFRKDPWFSWYY